MARAEDHHDLTDVTAGTPMGEYLRRFWVPVLRSSELAHPRSGPVRVNILGDTYVAFRDDDGQVGILDEACAHRCASLFFGRAEGDGLRCIYHGWKYDRSGRCTEQPSEPAGSTFKDKIRVRAFATREAAGVVWGYFGPEDETPDFTGLEWASLPAEHLYVSRRLQKCNFVQAIEGGIDSSHVSVLHQDTRRWHAGTPSEKWENLFVDSAPKFYVEPTDYGLMIGARRNANGSEHYWRITQFISPWYTFVPRDGDRPVNAHAWIPIDNENTWTWSISYHPDRPLTRDEVDAYSGGSSIHPELIPGTFVPVRNQGNDYLVNRDLQHSGYFSGIEGIPAQDSAVQESMGTIADRTKEHLGTSDAAIIIFRRRMLAAARALADHGTVPSALDPKTHRVRSGSLLLPLDADWKQAALEACSLAG